MLLLDDIIKYINLPQKKIKRKSKDEILKLPDIFNTLHKAFKDSLYIKNNGNFYNTFLTAIDTNFQMSQNKADIIKDLRKKLWEKIDEKFKQYNYNRRRKFDKAKMTTELLDFNNESANPSDIIMKYIVDFFGINVYILNGNLNVDHIIATDEGVECIYKPCIIIFKDDDCFYPVSKDDKTIFLYSKDEIVKDLYEKFIPRKSSKAKKPKKDAPEQVEAEIVEVEPVKVEEPVKPVEPPPSQQVKESVVKKRSATTKMSIEDLQTLAREYGIEITKKKGEKDVNKTKKDLYDEINEYVASISA